ncbi:hypothetical protein Peur_033238 [Populus x canadensis]
MHWFDLHAFYQQVKWILKKPDGVIAAWCYTVPEVNDSVDSVLNPFYSIDSDPYWEPQRKLIDDKYEYFTYLRSWSAYQTAKTKGVELLRDDMIESFKRAWNEDGHDQKVVKFPVYRRIGKVGNA